MFDLDKWHEIWASIMKHPLRTILTAFGVAWGIFMLVLLLGAGKGLFNGVEHSFQGDAINSLWISTGRTSIAYNGLKEGRRIKLNNEDYDFLLKELEEIDGITGKYFLSGDQMVKYKDKSIRYPVQGIHPDGAKAEATQITKGRLINQTDIEETRKVTVFGGLAAEQIFGDEDPIGKEVSIDDVIYTVIGVFYDSEGEWAMKRIYLPISTVQRVYSSFDRIDQLIILAGEMSFDQMLQLEERTKGLISERKLIAPGDNRALRIWNFAEDYQSFTSLLTVINMIIWIVGIFSMIAGVIGVSNIMLIIVKDRTKEIGIRKAIGASPRSIVSMILMEALVITGVAGYIGLGLGILVLAALKDIETEFWRQPEINIGVAIGATIVLILAGALAGLIPAIKAARINPVKAIKDE